MAVRSAPITPENFKTAWKYAAGKQRAAMKKSLIRRTAVALAQIAFGCVFTVLATAIIYETGGSLARNFLNQIPKVVDWCRAVCGAVLEGAPEGTAWIIRCALLLWVLPFGIAFAASVPVTLLYHPSVPKQTGAMSEDAWNLWAMAKRAREYSRKGGNDVALIFAVLLGMFTVLFVLGDKSGGEITPAQGVLYGAAVIIGYQIVNLPLRLLMLPLHFSHVPKAFIAEAERCYLETGAAETKEELPVKA